MRRAHPEWRLSHNLTHTNACFGGECNTLAVQSRNLQQGWSFCFQICMQFQPCPLCRLANADGKYTWVCSRSVQKESERRACLCCRFLLLRYDNIFCDCGGMSLMGCLEWEWRRASSTQGTELSRLVAPPRVHGCTRVFVYFGQVGESLLTLHSVWEDTFPTDLKRTNTHVNVFIISDPSDVQWIITKLLSALWSGWGGRWLSEFEFHILAQTRNSLTNWRRYNTLRKQ